MTDWDDIEPMMEGSCLICDDPEHCSDECPNAEGLLEPDDAFVLDEENEIRHVPGGLLDEFLQAERMANLTPGSE